MEKMIEEAGTKKTFELDHKEIRLFIAGKNSTSNEEGRFEKCGGIYAPSKEAWVFPSPVDAINAFQTLE